MLNIILNYIEYKIVTCYKLYTILQIQRSYFTDEQSNLSYHFYLSIRNEVFKAYFFRFGADQGSGYDFGG